MNNIIFQKEKSHNGVDETNSIIFKQITFFYCQVIGTIQFSSNKYLKTALCILRQESEGAVVRVFAAASGVWQRGLSKRRVVQHTECGGVVFL